MEVIITPGLKFWVICFVMFIACFLQREVEIFGIIFIQVVGGQVCSPSKPPLERKEPNVLFIYWCCANCHGYPELMKNTRVSGIYLQVHMLSTHKTNINSITTMRA
jgi:hypothetical protein